MSRPRVGFIGLGSQGGPMARRIAEDGFPTTLWARRPEALEDFADTPAVVVATPADLGAASDIVGICVVADADVEDVLLREDGVVAGMAPGGTVVVHSTVHPDTCRRLAGTLNERGIELLDAPVSGGGHAAAARQLLVMAGGSIEALDRCRPVLDTFADPIIHLGPVGAGASAKAINNLVFTAHLGIALEAFAYATTIGVDQVALAEVLDHGSGGSKAAGYVAMAGFDAALLAGFADLLRKDVEIALGLGDAPPELVDHVALATLRRLSVETSTETGG